MKATLEEKQKQQRLKPPSWIPLGLPTPFIYTPISVCGFPRSERRSQKPEASSQHGLQEARNAIEG